jgi:maltose/moltooligosaccharide transporter
MDRQKTNWWQVILVLLVGAGAIDGFLWFLYNTYIPLYLQGGNPNFQADVVGFGLTPKAVGFILVLDNIVAFILAPIIGAWSDGYRGRFGRRMVFVVATVPLAAIAIALIPFIQGAIPPESSGDLELLISLFIPFLIALFFIIVPLAIARVPIDALVYDLAPSHDRSKARSLGIILATLLGIGLGIAGGALYEVNPIYPFLLASLVSIVLLIIAALVVHERPAGEGVAPELAQAETRARNSIRRTLQILRGFPPGNRRSILFLAINIFLGMFAFSLIQAFISSYNMTVLDAPEAQAGLPFLIAGATMMLVSFPAALLAGKIGRKRTMLIGCIGWALAVIVIYLVPSRALFIPLMVVTGIFYGLWFVNSFVALVDAAPDDQTVGTMTALTGMANMAGMSFGPLIAGIVIEASGYNYGVIFPIQAVALVLAILALLPVKKGEVRTPVAQSSRLVEPAPAVAANTGPG